MFLLHVGTKTNDIVFHKASEGFYETLFDVAHGVAEAMQDTKMNSPINAKQARTQSYDILEKAKGLLESMVNENKDIAMDNVLRGLVDKLWVECGTARGFYAGTPEDDATKETKTEEDKPSTEEVKEEEAPESEDEEEDENKDADASAYWMEIKVEVEDEPDIDNMTPEEMKEHMKKMMKKKEKADESNNKMW